MIRENQSLELKETVSNSFLKTVSAFANYHDGEIIFGVNDEGDVVGIEDIQKTCLSIENQINDSIKPKPDYSLKTNLDRTITLSVKKGQNTPYRYHGKAYKRNDTATIEVDEIEENRLVLQGMNLSFEELPSKEQELFFDYLSRKITEALDLESFNLDTLKSLTLFHVKTGYNNAAALFSDTNSFPGLDIVVFGSSINVMKRRVTLAGQSILKQYYDALDIFRQEYVYEVIEDGVRKKKECVPIDAFREAVANALIHRAWDIKANTKIEMHPDRIIISSPGGLMPEMTEEDYRKGNFSYLRNPIIANIFRRMNIIEAFATGIKRINELYRHSSSKPLFDVTQGSISVTLPLLNNIEFTANEEKIFYGMKSNISYTRTEVETISSLNKDTVIRTLNSLIEKGVIMKKGSGKATVYRKR